MDKKSHYSGTYECNKVSKYFSAIKKSTNIYLKLLFDGLPELANFGLDAVRELTVVFVQVPQKTGQ